MKHNFLRPALVFVAVGLLAACGTTGTTAVPTETSLPLTSTAVPTATPIPSATRRPTTTPRPTGTARPTVTKRPTKTLRPTIAAPRGFKAREGGGITLWLPESYEGGSMTDKDRELMLKNLRSLGDEFANVTKQFEAMSDKILFFAFDSAVIEQGGVTTVNVLEVPIYSGMKPMTLAKLLVEQLPKQFKGVKLGQVEAVELPYYTAARFTAQLNLYNLDVEEVMYVIRADDATYAVTFATLAPDFKKLLPVFEQSIQTFTAAP